ncbi:hypothetical protein PG993_002013 [Apiospora rasikravindrae]|uniref:Rhodopsin domain-containing protein n=1 Tax=Apiospora rasikravindrae TaxID=990691 RepID=A0ABR1UD44_9PEZI
MCHFPSAGRLEPETQDMRNIRNVYVRRRIAGSERCNLHSTCIPIIGQWQTSVISSFVLDQSRGPIPRLRALELYGTLRERLGTLAGYAYSPSPAPIASPLRPIRIPISSVSCSMAMANTTTKARLDDLPADFVSFNQGPVAERVAGAMIGLSGGFVLLRLAARATRKARLGLDDWIILAALWTFISEITYGATITAVKLSILAMYDRLFPTKFMRRAVLSLAIVAMLWYLAVVLVVIFQCDPIPRSWGGTTEGHCIDHYSYYTGLAVPHIVIDIIILSLPIREVRRLQIVNWQKAAVCGMFLLGSFVTLVSVIRLKFVAEMVNTEPGSDTTMVVSTAIWSAVEVGVAIMCACLPTLQPLIRMASAYIIRKTQQSSSSSSSKNAPGRSAFPPGSRGSRGWTGDSSRPLNHADSEGSFKYAQDDLELGRLGREHPAFRNSFPMGLNIMSTAGRRSEAPLTLSPTRAERPLSLGLQGILKKSYI